MRKVVLNATELLIHSCLIEQGVSIESSSLVDIVYGIVLWDNICVVEDPAHNAGSFIQDMAKHSIRCEVLPKIPICSEYSSYVIDYIKSLISDIRDCTQSDADAKSTLQLIAFLSNSITYFDQIAVASSVGADCLLPTPEPESIKLLGAFDDDSVATLRKDAVDKVDNELMDFYKMVNEAIGKRRVAFEMPVLLDYLSEKYPDEYDILKAAVELHDERNVRLFRRELQEVEEAWEAGDLVAVDEYFRAVDEAAKRITKTMHTDGIVTFGMTSLPSIEVPLRTIVDKLNPRKHQLLFLRDLATFGARGRSPMKYGGSRKK